MSVPPPHQRANTSSGFRPANNIHPYMSTSMDMQALPYPASMRHAMPSTSTRFGVPSMDNRPHYPTGSHFEPPMIPNRATTQAYFHPNASCSARTSSSFYNPHMSSDSLYDPERPAMTHAGIPTPMYPSSAYTTRRTSSPFAPVPYY